jgi:hypothetical protein
MLPTNSFISQFQYLEPAKLDIVLELRNIIASVAPDATEMIQRKGMTYFVASRGGTVSAGICQILLAEDQIRLAFNHGAFLPDPRGLLEGDRIAKRFLRISSFEDAPWEYLRELITSSYRFDPYTSQFKDR